MRSKPPKEHTIVASSPIGLPYIPPHPPHHPHFPGPSKTHLLCLEAVLQLQPQLVRLVLHQARGPQAGSGLHAECGVTRPLSHGVEVRVLHGRVAALGHLRLRRVLLREDGGLLLQQEAGLLAGELLRVHRLALQSAPENKATHETAEDSRASTRLLSLTATHAKLFTLHSLHKGTFSWTSRFFPEKPLCSVDPVT